SATRAGMPLGWFRTVNLSPARVIPSDVLTVRSRRRGGRLALADRASLCDPLRGVVRRAHDQPAGLAVPRVVPVHGEVCAAVGAVQPEPERAVGPWYVDRLPGGDPQLRPGVVANRLPQP